MERLSHELNMREPSGPPLSAAAARLDRFSRCFDQARKKIKAGKSMTDLHIHERLALQDAAEFDDITVEALFLALKK